MPTEGFEPPTYGLQNRCTTTVLSRLAMSPIILDSCRPASHAGGPAYCAERRGLRSASSPLNSTNCVVVAHR